MACCVDVRLMKFCVFFIKFSTSVLLKEPLKTNGSFIKTYCVWVASPFLPLPLPLCSTMLWSHLLHLWKCNNWNNGNLLCLWLGLQFFLPPQIFLHSTDCSDVFIKLRVRGKWLYMQWVWHSGTETMAGFLMWFCVCWSFHLCCWQFTAVPIAVLVVVCCSKAPVVVFALCQKSQFDCGPVSSWWEFKCSRSLQQSWRVCGFQCVY